MNRGVKPSKANGTGNPCRGIEMAGTRGIWLEDSNLPKGSLSQGITRAVVDLGSGISVFVEASLFPAHDKPRPLLRLKRFLSFQSAARARQRQRPPDLGKARICRHDAVLPAPSHRRRLLPLPQVHSATLETPFELSPHGY